MYTIRMILMNRILLLLFSFLLMSTSLFAQGDLYINEFTDPSMFHFVGNAKLFNKRIRLTDATYTQGGGIWLKEKRNVARDFSIQIGFQITEPGNSGADGIAFVIQNSSATAIGVFGGGIGYMGIPNSLAIEFDTYPNSEYRDPNDNHIGIQTRGIDPNSPDHIITLGTSRNIPVLEDGSVHVMRIDYVNNIMKVYLDEFNTPKITAYVKLDSLLDLDNQTAWLGFTSSTGGAFANHDIVSFGHKSTSNITVEGLSPAGTLCPNQVASLIGSTTDSANVTSWTWNLPGETKTGKIVQFSRPIAGTYPVQLIIRRSPGMLIDTINTTVKVENPLTVTVRDSIICAQTPIVIPVSVQGAQGTLTYQWSSLDGNNIEGRMDTSTILTKPLNQGVYRFAVLAKDALGCEKSDTMVLTVRALPQIQPQATILACRNDIVRITPTVNSSSGALTYSWSPIDGVIGSVLGSTLTVKREDPGTHQYVLFIKDAFGCTATYTYSIRIADAPIVNAGSDAKVLCIGDTIEIGKNASVRGGLAPYQYQWKRITTGNAHIVNENQANTFIYPTMSGNYELSVTDANGCIGKDTIFVDVRLIPDANAGQDITECVCDQKGGEIGVAARCGVFPFIYRWSALGNAPLSALSALNTVPVTVKVNENPPLKKQYGYILTVTDGQNVSRSDTVFYILNPCPKVDAGRSEFICSPAKPFRLAPTIIADPTDTLRYEWSPSTFLDNPNDPRPLVTLPDSTFSITYTLTVSTSSGCMGMDTVKFETQQSMSLKIDRVYNKSYCICRGDSVIFNVAVTSGTPPYSYEWIPLGVTTSSSQYTVKPLINTLYSVLVKDSRGCSAIDTVSVCVEPVPNPRPAADTTICFGDVTPSRGEEATCGKPPFTYQWSPIAGIDNPSIYNPRFSPDTTTVYTLTVTDDGGKSSTAVMVINVRPQLNMNLTLDSLMCKGGSIAATIHASGGTPPYAVNWKIDTIAIQQVDTLLTISGLDKDFVLSCTITDSAGCTISTQRSVIVNGPNLSFPDRVSVCPCDSVIIGGEANGGKPSYVYEWRDLDGLKPLELRDSTSPTTLCIPTRSREYILTAIDANGCAVTKGVSVEYDNARTSVLLHIPTVKAHPLEKKAHIPIMIEQYPSSLACPPRSISLQIQYDPWIFDPNPTLNRGRIVNNIVNGRVRTLDIVIDNPPILQSGDTLLMLTGAAIMGDPGKTTIHVDSLHWSCSTLQSNSVSGMFVLDSLCRLSDSSVRMFDFSGMPFLQSIQPSPALGVFTVNAIRFHGEEVILTLFDAKGSVVDTKTWTEQIQTMSLPEHKSFMYEGQWPAGMYRLVLQSRYGRDSQQCIIIR